MQKRKIGALVTTVALAIGLAGFAASPAGAEEVPSSPDTSTPAVVTPTEPASPAPGEEVSATTPVSAPVESGTPTPPSSEEPTPPTEAPTSDTPPADHIDSAQDPAQAPVTAQPAPTARVAPAVEYINAFWSMPTWAGPNQATWGQDILTTVPSGAGLIAVDSDNFPKLGCGLNVQQDVYIKGEVTTALIAAGHLNGPNDPAEALMPGGWGTSYTVFQTAACPPPVLNQLCESPASGPQSTNVNDLWVDIDTRSAGHHEYVSGGLRTYTDDATSNAKVSEGIAVNFALKNTGSLDLNWTGSTPPPGINLFVNFGADGNGTLVYESIYGQDLWLTNGSSAAVKANAPSHTGGNGSDNHGTINEWLTKYPDAQVTGIAYSLGSGVFGDGVIHSITAGCTTYTFDYEIVIPEKPAPIVTHDSSEATDCEAGIVTTHHTTTTIDFAYDQETNTWIQQEPVTTQDEDTTRDATLEECPIVTPTPTPTPTVPVANPTPPAATPVAAVSADRLASTGSDLTSGWYFLGGALLIAGLILAFGRRITRRHTH